MGTAWSSPANVLSQAKIPGHENPYALVTGATSGIGRDMVNNLCQRGLNVVVHGRDPKRLESVLQELRAQHAACDIRGVIIDAADAFGASGEPTNETEAAIDSIKHLNIKVLINNVGMGHNPTKDFIAFAEQTPAQITRLINVNIVFMTFLTHALLPTLQRTATAADPSLVINCGSMADIGLPWMSVYSGTKAYISSFSMALDTELKGEGQHVQVVSALIGDTDSDGHKVGTNLFTPSSPDMARMILDSAAAAGSGGVVRIPYWGHSVQAWACKIQPYRLLQKGIIYNVGMLREKNGLVSKKAQ